MIGFFEENRNIQKVIAQKYPVIIYAENAYYFKYLRHLIAGLLQQSVRTCYITSDHKDPLLNKQNEFLDVVFSRNTLAFLFRKMKADIVVMTMPDLDQFQFRRSPDVKKYVYVFHALVSTHQQYRKGAFDHYDTIFCCGPHHIAEIRETEKLYGLPVKELVDYGYPLLEDLTALQNPIKESHKKILIAPSWYDQGILQTCILDIINLLGKSRYEVLVRPHPEFVKRNKKAFDKMQRMMKPYSNISIDLHPELMESILSADQLITDRSGIAFEYAFVKKTPVIFIDTPLKVQNPEAGRMVSEPVENLYRESIGQAIPVNELDKILRCLDLSDVEKHFFSNQIEAVKKTVVFDPSCLDNGIEYITDQIS